MLFIYVGNRATIIALLVKNCIKTAGSRIPINNDHILYKTTKASNGCFLFVKYLKLL